MPQKSTELAAEMAAGLRALADLIESSPELVTHLTYPLRYDHDRCIADLRDRVGGRS